MKRFRVQIDIWDGQGRTPNGICTVVYLSVVVEAPSKKAAEDQVNELLRADAPFPVTLEGMKMATWRVRAASLDK